MRFASSAKVSALFVTLMLAACAPPRPPGPPGPPEKLVIATEARVEAPKAPRLEVSGESTPNLVRLDKEQEVFVRIRVRGLPLASKKRPPLNLSLVVDTSGSMEGAAIDRAREACATLLDLLSEGDVVSIVTFGSRAKVVVPAVRITADSRDKAKKALKELTAEGTTDMAGGLAEGLNQVRTHLTAEGIHRLVLVGDGVPNDAPEVLALADRAKIEHVPVTALGLGNDFDETLMTALAQRSSGTFHFVDDAARVGAVFKEQISRMERVVAQNTRVELTPGPGVTIAEVVGIPSSMSGRSHTAELGALAEGQTRDLFVRVTAKGRQDGKSVELLDARLTYMLPEGGSPLTANAFVKLGASSDEGRLKDAAVVEIEHAATIVRVADGIVKAIGMAREGDLPNARKVLEASLRLAKEGEKKFSDKALGEKVLELTKLRKTLPSLVPPPPPREEAAMGPVSKTMPPRAPSVATPAPSPAEAMDMRAAHGKAMKDIQGDQ